MSVSRLILLPTLAVTFGAAAPAPPLPAPPAPPAPITMPKVDPATLRAAGRLLDAMGYETMMAQMIDQMSAQFGPQMKQSIEAKTGKPANPEMIRRLAEAQRRFMIKFTSGPRLRQATELLYAKHFTAAELDRMAVLMKDPVMQRWNERVPQVMTDMMPLITQQIDANGGELREEITAIILEYVDAPAPGSDVN